MDIDRAVNAILYVYRCGTIWYQVLRNCAKVGAAKTLHEKPRYFYIAAALAKGRFKHASKIAVLHRRTPAEASSDKSSAWLIEGRLNLGPDPDANPPFRCFSLLGSLLAADYSLLRRAGNLAL